MTFEAKFSLRPGKALFKCISDVIQMPHWLSLTVAVSSVRAAHAQSERERKGGREGKRDLLQI